MSGFSSVVGLSQAIANTLYEVINAVATHTVPINILDGIAPTFTSWTTDPGTAAQILADDVLDLDTAGVAPTTTSCSIDYDLGAVKAAHISLYGVNTEYSGGASIQVLVSGSWRTLVSSGAVNAGAHFAIGAYAKCSHIRFTLGGGSAAATTWTKIKACVYRW